MSNNEFIKRAKRNIARRKIITEVDIEDSFVKYAESKGCKAFKLVFLSGRGFPDRTILCPGGRIFFIEFKRKGGKVSEHQKKVRKLLIDLGFYCHICDAKGQAEKILDGWL